MSDEFNSEAFVDCTQYEDFDEVCRRVQEIDNDDDLWVYMITREWQTEDQKKASHEEYMRYREFITNIFSQTLKGAIRRPIGSWPDKYTEWFMSKKIRSRLIRAFRHPELISRKLKIIMMRETDIDEFFRD